MSDLVDKVRNALSEAAMIINAKMDIPEDKLVPYGEGEMIFLSNAAILAVLDGMAEPSEAMIRVVDRSDLRQEIIARHRAMIAALRKEIANEN